MNRAFQRINLLLRPGLLLLGLVFYLLGVGISRYLGSGPNWTIFWLGMGWMVSLQLACQFFQLYFQKIAPDNLYRRQQIRGDEANLGVDINLIPARNFQLAAFTSLTACALFTVTLIGQGISMVGIVLFLLAGFAAGFFYSAPPFQLEFSGYGELTFASLVTLLIPAFAFYIQDGTLHRLVAMSSFPLLALCLAMLIAGQISVYGRDLRNRQKNLTIRLGWKNAMTLHNLLILGAYLLVGIAASFGYPDFAWIAGLLSIPAGLLQIWQMWRISQGGKPNWRGLTLNAMVTFVGMAYLLAYSFWTH